MRTPYGAECSYFYGNYFRGKSEEECRLIGHHPTPNNWTRDLCQTCPVPAILRANACSNMSLTPTISRKFIIGKRQVEIKAYCSHSQSDVKIPQVGCGSCHTIGEILASDDQI